MWGSCVLNAHKPWLQGQAPPDMPFIFLMSDISIPQVIIGSKHNTDLTAPGSVKIRQSFNKAHLDWHSRLKGGEKVKDGLVKMISKGHCWKKSGGKVIYIWQPTLYELIKAIMSLGICVIRFQTCLSASAFMSQWLSVAVQLFSQQINNQIKALMWKHNHFRELNFIVFPDQTKPGSLAVTKKARTNEEQRGIETQLTEKMTRCTMPNPLNLSYWIKTSNPADSKWHRD